ncbi:MAG: hypothetical protein ACI88G_000790 [Woeseiaceae bacterium]|jgi:hypothetical protein
MSIINKFLREPLVHFFLLGAALFVAYGWLDQDTRSAPDEIVIHAVRINNLAATFAKTWSRPPTSKEMQGLIDAWVREEVLYREGIAVGFDRNDPIIRRRVAQKMTFVSDGLVPEIPLEEELQAWLDEHVSDYMIPAVYSFSQVYFDPQRHGENLQMVLSSAENALASGVERNLPGDRTMLPAEMVQTSETEVRRTFGQQFADGLATLEAGVWAGPLSSGYGVHFVRINDFVSGRKPSLDEVRSAVKRDVLKNVADEIGETFYQALRDRYTVRVETEIPETGQ